MGESIKKYYKCVAIMNIEQKAYAAVEAENEEEAKQKMEELCNKGELEFDDSSDRITGKEFKVATPKQIGEKYQCVSWWDIEKNIEIE
jgi:hypothetical protein